MLEAFLAGNKQWHPFSSLKNYKTMPLNKPVIPAPIFIGMNSSRNPGFIALGTGFPFPRE
jgi:hypothetical protein